MAAVGKEKEEKTDEKEDEVEDEEEDAEVSEGDLVEGT
jgi:hypothetical protein